MFMPKLKALLLHLEKLEFSTNPIRRYPMNCLTGSLRKFSFFSVLFLFALATQTASAETHGEGQGRAISSGGTTNCLAELNAAQLEALARVRQISGGRYSPQEMAERSLQAINQANLTEQQRGAVAALAFGELNRAARLRMQDPNGDFKVQVQKLVEFGAVSTPQGLDLKGLDLSKLDQFKKALEDLFPESKNEISKINQSDNNTPVVLGNYIILGKWGWGDSTARIMTLTEYKTGVGNQLQTIQQAFRTYQESSNSANSTLNLLGSIFRSGPSQAERNANQDFAHLITQIGNLGRLYDYPNDKVNELTEQVRQELGRENRNIDSALTQVYWAAGAIAAAPLAWPILAIGGTTAAVSMGTSVAFSATSIVGNAALATTYRNGDFACNLGRQLLAQGPQAMVQALVGGTLGAVLPGASALTGNALRDIVGERVLNGISLIAVGALVAPGLYHTGEAMISASDLAIMAEAANADGKHELANEYRQLAAQARLSAAQGVAASVVLPLAARYMARTTLTADEKAIGDLASKLRFTVTAGRHMGEAGRFVPRHTLADAILNGTRMADPQGAAGAIKIVQQVSVNGRVRTLEIIYRERDNTILHFLYR